MARFMTRVELHNAPHDGTDYDKLHEQMGSRGFRRTISSSDATYHLPPAEYYIEGNYSRDGVLAAAKESAQAIGYTVWSPTTTARKTFAAITSEAPASTWAGLEKVE